MTLFAGLGCLILAAPLLRSKDGATSAGSSCAAIASGVAHPPATQKQQTSDSDEQAGTTFRVNVKLVNVFTTVTDAEGRPVSSLKEDDFQRIRGWQAAEDRGVSS